MYTPPYFRVEDKESLYKFIKKYSFATLFSQTNGHPIATHLPILLNENGNFLYSHMSKVNSQWEEVQGDVLVVFHGPHTYISPSWYETDDSVPTWNYVAVHVYGEFEIIHDEGELLNTLEDSVEYYESRFPKPWSLDKADPDYISKLSKAIVGFKVKIKSIDGKWKLSQNHSEERQRSVIRALESFSDDNSREIAELMNNNLINNIDK